MRLGGALERRFPERRVFLRTDEDTRFVRLSPGTQAGALLGGAALLSWTVLATSLLIIDGIGGGAREQAQREQALYESRLDDLSSERDARAADAARSDLRFNEAMDEIGRMQTRLLEARTQIRELEAGFEIAAGRTRDARAALRDAESRLAADDGAPAAAADESMGVILSALDATSAERDALREVADTAEAREAELMALLDAERAQAERIFAQLESAVEVSMAPMERMFASAGVSPDAILRAVRSGYSGSGGPLTPIISSRGAADPLANRANDILGRMGEIDAYRRAAARMPFADPVPSRAYRQTSGFGPRRDPLRGGRRMHNGLDFAGARGTPIHATAAGTVTRAGWFSGYGKTVDIDHGHGFMTRYAHLDRIAVSVGERVSRMDLIGGMGTTGRSTGVHLHYEVHRGGTPVNPMTFIRAARDVF